MTLPLSSKPWLKSYDENVPHNIDVPNHSLQHFLEEQTINNYYYTYTYGESAPVADEALATAVVAAQQIIGMPPAGLPEPSAAAYEAIVVFANDQLGATVVPVYAGEVTADILALLEMLPVYVQNPAYGAYEMAAVNYYALLQGGVGAVSIGECAEGDSCQIGDDIPAELSSASLGVYALQTSETMPVSESDALALVTLVYPRLTGLEFSRLESAEGEIPGYAFSATTTSVAQVNGQPGMVTKVVVAGVLSVDGRTVVYAAVGVGEAYAAVANPFTPR